MPGSRPLGVLADDLSGAVETAAVLGPGTPVLLTDGTPVPPQPVVVDADARLAGPAAAATSLGAAAERLGRHTLAVKVDSLLRGPVAASVAVAARGGRVVLCPALPAHGRVVRDGVLRVDGVPLDRTPAWRLEPSAPPARVSDLLPGPSRLVTRARLHDGGLEELLGDRTGCVLVVDAEDADDLRVVGEAVRRHDAVAVGSSQLLAAVAGSAPPAATPAPTDRPSRWLVVVGSASAEAAEQVRRLRQQRRCRVLVAPLLPGGVDGPALAPALTSALGRGDVVLTLPPAEAAGRREPAAVAAQLGTAVAAASSEHPAVLVLVGGATARGVLAATGTERLDVVAQIHPGAVASTTPDHRLVVTRPGSHGSPDSLVQVLDWLEGTPR
ncbi:four-carbon acid sugar kinase family protein [Auraticoccus monumenti]|uniref:Uncharacterized conserved protein YgbK, DUF1537 family n=1 Tax=Auraticoccus monumenti TaxID=675864 RepID=A0A1G6YEW1_9ACTN|nr:four-carbon acid sugar kinase family protein [Auraticoccus monumenti]SDD88145.1 Uncharacterized conserved protein YgbK, DUF1537 family [Auraticoccus monumenti]